MEEIGIRSCKATWPEALEYGAPPTESDEAWASGTL